MKFYKTIYNFFIVFILYTYIIFFFQLLGAEQHLLSVHWVILLVLYLGMGVLSYYPLHFNVLHLTSILGYFISWCFIGFFTSSLLYTVVVNDLVVPTTNLRVGFICILYLFFKDLLISYFISLVVWVKPKIFTLVSTIFSLWIIFSHALLISFVDFLINNKTLTKVINEFGNTMLFTVLVVYGIILLPLVYYIYRRSKRLELNISWDTYILILCSSFACTYYILPIYDSRSFVFYFLMFVLAVVSITIIHKRNVKLLKGHITSQIDIYRQNTQIMNQYYQKLSLDNETLSLQNHQMEFAYHKMLAFYPDPLFILIDFNICEVNEFAMKLLEFHDRHKLIGEDLLSFISPYQHDNLRALIYNLSPTDPTPVNSDFELITASGKTIYVEGSFILTSLYDTPSIILSVRDISFHKETYELQKQIEMEKLKVEFFSTLSHELRTPVNIIYSASQLQDNMLKNNQYHELGIYNEMINHNCLRLLRLLNNILDVSRLESNYFHIKPECINIVNSSESILESIIPYANKKHITPIFDTDYEEVYCHLDPELFERILLNLLSNAVKYGREGGHIYMNVEVSEDHVLIHVKDDGVGISEETLPYIFNRFMRVENGLIRNAEGSGIGLSLVKSLVERNNGTITASSTQGEGSTFTLSFPLHHSTEDCLSTYNPQINSSKIDLEFSDVFLSKR